MTDQSVPAPTPVVLVGNEAGRYLAKRLREMVGEFGNNTTFTEHLLRVADDLAEKGAGSDEQLAYEKGLAENAELLRATQEQLARAVKVADEAIDWLDNEVSSMGYEGDSREARRDLDGLRAQVTEIEAWQRTLVRATAPQTPSRPRRV